MIIVIEPQCSGYEHSDVNAALLAIIRGAFPSEKITFYAESSHLNLVKENTQLHKLGSIEFNSIQIPNMNFSDARRIGDEWKLVNNIFQKAEVMKANRIIFASLTSAGLWSIKLHSLKKRKFEVIVIPHSVLESITEKPSINKPWILLFWFRYALLFFNKPQLHYLLLGESNSNNLCKIMPKMQPYVQSIDLPYFFKDIVRPSTNLDTTLRFGSFGDWHSKKGTDLFFKLAIDVHQKTDKNRSEFILIGHIRDIQTRNRISSINTELVIPSISRPLIRKDFEDYANKINYAVFCFKPKSFRLTVSGSFYDALSHVKPIIAIKTPFFEYYFNKMGDIGYLCEDYDEMLTIIVDLIQNKNPQRYSEQCNNIVKGREMLEVATLSLRMRNIFDGQKT